MATLIRHLKSAGCPIPVVRNMSEREAYIDLVKAIAHVNLFPLILKMFSMPCLVRKILYFQMVEASNRLVAKYE